MPLATRRRLCGFVDAACRWGGGAGGRSGTRWALAVAALAFACCCQAQQQEDPTPAAGAGVQSHAARAREFLAGRRTKTGTAQTTAAQTAAAETVAAQTAAERLARARAEHQAMLAQPRASALGAAWSPVGPAQVLTAAYGPVTGRVTSVVIDPADRSGNTVYVGTTGGGVWKSTNAAADTAAVSFVPLTDTLPAFNANAGSSATASLSIGALGIGGGVLLAGSGDPNDATDSYYGSGMLRSADGGVTWTLIQGSRDGVAGNHSFFGLSFSGFAFSSTDPALVVAAVGQAAEGVLVNAPDQTNSVMGLYYSTDAGVTWQMASIYDGTQPVQTPQPSGGNNGGHAATAVVWNPLRQRFYAAVQFHGYYESSDGQTWTRLTHQPGLGLTTSACPTDPGSAGSRACPIFRGALAVQPVTGDLFALTVDSSDRDQGLWQDACAAAEGVCASSTVLFGSELGGAVGASPLEQGGGSTVIAQADYDLALAVSAADSDTLLYVGTMDLFRCSLAGGCLLRNTTNAQDGCIQPASVAGAQHAIATLATTNGPLVFLGNDGGIYRSTDGVAQTGPVCSASDAGHFQNLNPGIGSLAEVVSFAQDPVEPGTLLTGLGALGTAGTGSALQSGGGAWPQLSTGEGGTVAIDSASPLNWYVSTGAGVSISRCASGAACAEADFAAVPVIGESQVANDDAAIHAPWMLDPELTSDLVIGTCRAWRGPATGGPTWPGTNQLSSPFGAPHATGCSDSLPIVRSLGAGGTLSPSGPASQQGSKVLYAGLAGSLDGGAGFGGHVFTTANAQSAGATTAWTDAALSPVTNALSDSFTFNPGGFDISSVAVDPHVASGATVYVTVMGFAANGINAPHLYRSTDGGAHWLNISSNLPNAPANSIAIDPNDANTIYVAMDTGVYVTQTVTSCSSANCWSVYGVSLPNAPVLQLETASAMTTGDGRTGELRAATYGRGIWQIPLLTAISPAAPGIAVDLLTLNFPDQQAGTISAALPVTVTNSGDALLTVSGVTASGDFTESDNCTAAAIVPEMTCTVQVSFLPSAAGARTGLLTVFGNAPGGQATVALTGNGTAAAAIVLTPVSLLFPATNLGAVSAVENITISNLGGTMATLSAETVSGDFAISQNTCGSGLAPQTGCTVSLVFQPSASGSRTGLFTVVDSAGTQTASLIGTGTAPATGGLAPAALTFGAQALNTLSATQTVTLTNTGDVPLTLIAAQITAGDFTVVNGCANSLNGHASCMLSVAFAPKRLGQQNGTLTVADQFRSQSVTLNGLGIAPAGVSLAPLGGLSFGPTALGSAAAAQTVTLTNNGGEPLTVAGIAVTGDFMMVAGANSCGAVVAVGAACTMQIGFTPTVAGARGGTLTVTTSAPNSPETMALAGIGVDFSLAADGPVSATIASGQNAHFLLLLSSVDGLSGSVALSCSGAPANALCTVNPATTGLGGTTVITVTVATGVSTAVNSAALRVQAYRGLIWAAWIPLGLFGLAGGRRGRRLFALAVVVCLIGMEGCGTARVIPATSAGSGGSGPVVTTPSGAYPLTISGTDVGLTRTVNLSVMVQ